MGLFGGVVSTRATQSVKAFTGRSPIGVDDRCRRQVDHQGAPHRNTAAAAVAAVAALTAAITAAWVREALEEGQKEGLQGGVAGEGGGPLFMGAGEHGDGRCGAAGPHHLSRVHLPGRQPDRNGKPRREGGG